MTAVKTQLDQPSGSRPVQPTAEVPRSNLDLALDYIGENMGGGGSGSGAPDDVEYLVASGDSGLSNERVATNTSTIEWDFSTTGQAKANVAGVLAEIAALSDPGADRLFAWDDSAGGYRYFTAGTGLGFVGTNFSITDAELVAIAGLTSAADKAPYFTGSGTAALMDVTSFARSLLDDATAQAARATLGLDELGNIADVDISGAAVADVLYYTGAGWAVDSPNNLVAVSSISDVDVSSIADGYILVYDSATQTWVAEQNTGGSASGAPINAGYYTTAASGTLTNETVVPAFMQTLLDDTTATAARVTLGLEIGVDVQAFDAELAALAGLTSAADRLPYFTGSGTASLATFTAFARSILDDADEATFKATVNLEIGTDVQAYSANLDDWSSETPTDYALLATLASTSNGDGAALIGIEDAGGLITATTVEGALAENRGAIDAIEADYLTSSDIANMLETGDIGVSVQAWDAQLDSLSAASANGVSLVTAANYAAMRTLLDLEAGTDFYSISGADAAFQPLDSDLTSWAGVARASGFDTFAATPSSANLASLVTGETGSGALVFANSPTLVTPALGTPSSGNLSNCTSYPSAAEGTNGIVDQATDAEIQAATAGAHAIMAEDLGTAAAPEALSDAATVAVVWTNAINFTLTVTANRTLGNPSAEIPGQIRTILVQGNDGTSRTLAFGSEYGGEVPSLTDITSTKKYFLQIYCKSAGQFIVTAIDGSDA